MKMVRKYGLVGIYLRKSEALLTMKQMKKIEPKGLFRVTKKMIGSQNTYRLLGKNIPKVWFKK